MNICIKGKVHLQLLVPIDFHSMEKKNAMQVNGDQLEVNYPFKNSSFVFHGINNLPDLTAFTYLGALFSKTRNTYQ